MPRWNFAYALLGFMINASALAAPLVVLVDPGHGGADHGAVRDDHREADITLNVARSVYDLLKADRQFRPHLTRQDGRGVSLSERSRQARELEADVFVSIHVNSSPDPKARGAEFYFQNQLPPDEESMRLAHRENSEESTGDKRPYRFLEKNRFAQDVHVIVNDLLDGNRVLRSSQLSKALKMNWRGSRKSKLNSIRQAPFFVLSQMTVPSSLIELGFLTNPQDVAELSSMAAQKRMADDIYRGLKAYKESIDKAQALP